LMQGASSAGQMCHFTAATAYPKEIIDITKCSIVTTGAIYAELTTILISPIAFLLYGITGFGNTVAAQGVATGPVRCLEVRDPVVCSRLGTGNALASSIVEQNYNRAPYVLYVRENPICVYMVEQSQCVYSADVAGLTVSDSSCTNPTFKSTTSAGVDTPYFEYLYDSSTCVKTLELNKYLDSSDSKHSSVIVNVQEYPIHAGVQTAALAVISGPPFYALQAVDKMARRMLNLLDGGIDVEEARKDTTTAAAKATLGVTNAFKAVSILPYQFDFDAFMNGLLLIRDMLVGVVMSLRGVAVTLDQFVSNNDLINAYTSIAKVIMDLVEMVEMLSASLGESLIKLVSDVINLMLKIFIAIGSGAASSPEGLKDLASAVWQTVKDWSELLVGILQNMFQTSSVGKTFTEVAQFGCTTLNTLSNILDDVKNGVCSVIGKISHFFHFGRPGFCSSTTFRDPLKDKCNFNITTKPSVLVSFEADVCMHPDSCKFCVARNPNDCALDYTKVTDDAFINLIKDSIDEFAVACPCDQCRSVEKSLQLNERDYYCDQASGLCVCGTGRVQLKKENFDNQNNPDSYVSKTSLWKGGDDFDNNIRLKQRLVIDADTYDGFCLMYDFTKYSLPSSITNISTSDETNHDMYPNETSRLQAASTLLEALRMEAFTIMNSDPLENDFFFKTQVSVPLYGTFDTGIRN